MITPPRLPAVENRPGWETRWQLTLIEPMLEPPEELADLASARPRLNVVVSVVPADQDVADAAAEKFVNQVRSQVPRLELESERVAITFHDGSLGVRQDISFFAAGVKLRQAHFFRKDSDVMTQIVVTRDDERSKDDFDSVVADVLGFSPSSA
jgi:hypothetical protein